MVSKKHTTSIILQYPRAKALQLEVFAEEVLPRHFAYGLSVVSSLG